MKTLHTYKLKGLTYNGAIANTSQAEEVKRFAIKTDAYFQAAVYPHDGYVILKTKRGSYRLMKHNSQNYYFGTCNGTRVQVTLHKITGELRAWF